MSHNLIIENCFTFWREMFIAHVSVDRVLAEGGVEASVASHLAEDLVLAVVAKTVDDGRHRAPKILRSI